MLTDFVLFVAFCLKSFPMHPLYEKADKLSSQVIGAAIEVHRDKGPGLIESIYERCLLRELELRSIPATTQKLVRVEYKGIVFDEPLPNSHTIGPGMSVAPSIHVSNSEVSPGTITVRG